MKNYKKRGFASRRKNHKGKGRRRKSSKKRLGSTYKVARGGGRM